MKPLTIGAAARAAGIGVETVRFYERRGLIKQPKRPLGGGARNYDTATIERLRFIRRAKEIGFSLAEIAEILSLRDLGGVGCRSVRARAVAKRDDINGRLVQLKQMRDVLDKLIDDCPGEGELSDCTILEAIEAASG